MKPVEILAECLDGSPLTYACIYLIRHDNDWCRKNCKPSGTSKECWLRYAEIKSKEGESNDNH
jgi:hypothetical protein